LVGADSTTDEQDDDEDDDEGEGDKIPEGEP
jgi:hypothetical protein